MREKRKLWRILAVAAGAIPLMLAPLTALAATATISSSGPLEEIIISDELNCQVGHSDDSEYEFYSPFDPVGACTTQIHVDGTTYGPSSIPAGNNPVPFGLVSQSAVTGTGSSGDPYQIETVVSVGDTGLTIREIDSYVEGQEAYRTDVTIESSAQTNTAVTVYRAGDCYLQDSDLGFGAANPGTGSVTCVASDDGGLTPGDRIEQWIPLTPGSHYYEAFYASVWDLIQAGEPFPDTCECASYLDNGAGLSWSLNVPAGGSVMVSHLTVFSPLGTEPLTLTKTADQATSVASGTNGYEITVSNPNDQVANIDSISDTLPTGFSYVSGSTSGAIASDPTIVGQDLTWGGPLAIPANGSVSFSFDVTVAASEGSYFNSVTAEAGSLAVVPTGPTAPISVEGGVSNDPPVVDAGGSVSGSEGSAISLDGTVSDPDGDPVATVWSYVAGLDVDAGATCSFGDASAVDTTITCTDDGTFTATLTGDDGNGPAVMDSATVTVSNVAPSVSVVSPTDMSSYPLGAMVSVVASFSDPGSNDTHSCLIDWGDGTVEAGVVAGGECSGSHAYGAAGVYTVVMTVTDDDDGSGSDEIGVVVFDSATKVTGGGFLVDGARVSFGFVARSEGGLFSGQLQVRAPGKHKFHGDTVTSLVVSANTATWSGSGRWDGVDGYTFEVSVVDNRNGGGKSSKKGAPDTISIVVRDGTGELVFSTSGPLKGGNIKIH